MDRPAGVALVTVGGATLGGSGKTPLAIACARELARSGTRVAFVAHGYRARPGRARVVAGDEPVDVVGDESLVAAHALRDLRVTVVVGPTRAEAVALAARQADVLVVDGLLQVRPRAALSILAVDGGTSWAAGAVPPRGDLRAPPEALRSAADVVVSLGETSEDATVRSQGVWLDGRLVPWEALQGSSARFGLALALARPGRIVATLRRHGIDPVAVLRAPDHGPFSRRAVQRERRVDVWLASAKCAVHLRPLLCGVPLGVLDHTVLLSRSLAARLPHAP